MKHLLIQVCDSYVKIFQKPEEHLQFSHFSNQPISKHWFFSVILREGFSYQHLIVNTHSKVSATSGQQVLVVIKSKQTNKKKKIRKLGVLSFGRLPIQAELIKMESFSKGENSHYFLILKNEVELISSVALVSKYRAKWFGYIFIHILFQSLSLQGITRYWI